MRSSIEKLLSTLKPFLKFVMRYLVLIVFIIFALIYGVLVLRVNQLASSEPSTGQVSSKLSSIQRPKIDQPTLDKIQQLQNQNIEVQALFDQARNNPFSE